ncbi:phosphotransferase family protein [Paenibacillus radicis (ex Xue et al. 2023)]|uniref:Phosphotransferase n=1 Tax=Paenibacillus radicis (ex Xue et al. 2023) TaxID=2972489 RepID=A0ABT1YIT4_9BACL|nr:aminoglycoside phosphotransferase family protein [Paenibacillus radicis (ex Xue et al. 2023)]MCR8633083.1 phosphotransferase [Paenibacillus radicis (ex Xue et al. 2023)]
MKRIGEGRTAEIFEYSHEKVLKLYRTGFPKDGIKYEFEITRLVGSLGMAAPEVYELIEYEERVGIIFRFIEGTTLIQKMVENPAQLHYFSKMLAEMHFQIHKNELITNNLGMHLRKQKEVLAQNIHNASELSKDEKIAITRYLEKLPDGSCLCHGDFHPDNAMIGEKNWIIDWMTGMIGNPAGDVARTMLLFRFGTLPEGIPGHVMEALRLMRKSMGDGYIEQYLAYSGLQFEDIDQWTLPIAAARLVEWIPTEEKNVLVSLVRERLKQVSRDL